MNQLMDKICCCFPYGRGDLLGIFGDASIMKGRSLKIPRTLSVTDYFSRCISTGAIKGDTRAIIRDGCANYTFDQLEDKSTRLAKAIKEELDVSEWTCNNNDGDLVIAFCLGNTEVMIVTIFAIMKVGAAYLPVDPLTPEEYLVRIVAAVQPILIITESHDPIVSRFATVAHVVKIVTINSLLEKAIRIPRDLNDVVQLENELKSWQRTAAIYYTSGAGGRRRGVRINHLGILNRVMWQWDVIPYEDDDIACLLSQTVIHTSIPDIFAPLLNGIPLVILNRASIPKVDFLIENIVEQGVTRITVSSVLLTGVVTEIEHSANPNLLATQLGVVRSWICCGDMLTKDLCQRFFSALVQPGQGVREVNGKGIPKLVHIYGTTETTADATFELFYNEDDVREKSMDYQAPFGIPISNTMVYILADTQNILHMDEIGEIAISGQCLASGYISNDIASRFLPNHWAKSKDFSLLFRTGDLGRISEDPKGVRRLYHEGRCRSIIKVAGRKVDLNTVARVIRTTDLVDDVEILVYHPERDDQVIVAATVLKDGVVAPDITHAILDQVEQICIPEIYPVVSIPVLTDGRMDRHKLMHNYKMSRNISNLLDWNTLLNLPPEQIKTGKTLCEIVALSIGVSTRFVVDNFEDSFWHLGGNSTNVVLAVSRLRGKEYRISLEGFISAEFLPAIVKLMVESQNRRSDPGIQFLEKTQVKYAVLPMQEVYKDDVFTLICKSYLAKGRFASFLTGTFEDFHEFMAQIWTGVLKQNLSIVVQNKETEEIVAASINIDANTKPLYKTISKSIKPTFDVFEKCAENAKVRLTLSTGKLIQPFMMGTSENMTPGENALLINLLLKETIEKGLRESFTHIFIISGSTLMRQMCRNVLKCDVLLELPVNTFVAADNTKPFNFAGNYYAVSVYSKSLKDLRLQK